MTHSTKSDKKPEASYSFDAIGTRWQIELYQPVDDPEGLFDKIIARIAEFDKTYSRFREDSLVSTIARTPGSYTFPDDAVPMFELYDQFYRLSGGAVTPLIGETLASAGYDAGYSLQLKTLVPPPAWEAVVRRTGSRVQTTQPVLLDFGAAGKGYLVDIVAGMLEAGGIHGYCIDAGGDIVFHSKGNRRLKIGLEHPDNPQQVLGVAEIHNQSLCGSAGNRRAWGEFHHIIDPHTLTSPHHIKAVWVVAETGLLADGLATALFFVPANILAKHYTFEYAVVHEDYTLEHSAGFPATFFTGTNP